MPKSGQLFLVSTPIGNLQDASSRMISCLSEVDLIAAEDTRRALHLLNLLNIPHKKIIRCDEEVLIKASDQICIALESGLNVALITDAGTPCISDPGDRLVSICRQKELPIVSIPGCSSVLAALTLSGFPGTPFMFWGFLAKKGKKRTEAMEALEQAMHTTVFLESPHRLIKTVKAWGDILGDRRIFVGREITKKFEEHFFGTCKEVLLKLENKTTIKGECTLVVEPKKKGRSKDE